MKQKLSIAFTIFVSVCVMLFVYHLMTRNDDLASQMQRLFTKHLKRGGITPRQLVVYFEIGNVFLDVSRTDFDDLRLLHGMNIVELHANQTKITDLSPITVLKQLQELRICFTHINDLEPLRNLPLTSLDIGQTDVKDISPLTNTPLEFLYLSKTAVTNLDVVLSMDRLHTIHFSPKLIPKEQVERLRGKHFECINHLHPERFWEEYDSKELLREVAIP